MAQPLPSRTVGVLGEDVPATDHRVEDVYRRHAVQMWRALYAYSCDRQVADDAMAEAFAQALRRESQIRHVDRWVWRAAFRIAAGELKRRRRFVPPIDAPSDNPGTGIGIGLRDALMQLSPRQRASLFLFYYAGYPPGEIAQLIGSTQSAVRVHLHRGRKRLAAILDGGSRD